MQTNFKLGNSGLPQNTVISALRRRPCDLDKTQSISNMSCWTKNRKLRLFLIDLFYSSPSRHNQSSTLLNKKTNRGDHIKTLTSPVVTRMKARSEREDGWWLWLLKNNISNFSRLSAFLFMTYSRSGHIREVLQGHQPRANSMQRLQFSSSMYSAFSNQMGQPCPAADPRRPKTAVMVCRVGDVRPHKNPRSLHIKRQSQACRKERKWQVYKNASPWPALRGQWRNLSDWPLEQDLWNSFSITSPSLQ